MHIYWIRHAESCSNIVRTDTHVTDINKQHFVEETVEIFNQLKPNKKNKDEALFDEEEYRKLRHAEDDNGELTSFYYHPPLSNNGIDQALELKKQVNKESRLITILSDNEMIYISSPTLRTVMTALILLEDKISDLLKNENVEGKKLIKIYPHINEAMSSKVTNYVIANKEKFGFNELTQKYNLYSIEEFLRTQVQADFGIPHELIESVIRSGINWLIMNKYFLYSDNYDVKTDAETDVETKVKTKVETVMSVIDFGYYINYCEETIVDNKNPYIQNVEQFKKLLQNNKITTPIVVFTHFKVILNEINIVVKNHKEIKINPDDGKNTSVWLETTNDDLTADKMQLLYGGSEIRTHGKTRKEPICYVQEEIGLVRQVNELYENFQTNNPTNSTTTVKYFDPTILKIKTELIGGKSTTLKRKRSSSKRSSSKRSSSKRKRRHGKKYTKKIIKRKNKNKRTKNKNRKTKNKH